MFKLATVLLKGAAARSEEVFTDRHALFVLDQQMREAAAALEKAVQLLRQLPPSAVWRRRELKLLEKLGVALTNTKGPASDEVQQAQERAAAIATELGDGAGLFRAKWMLWRTTNVRAEYDDAILIGEELLDLTISLLQFERERLIEIAIDET